MRKRQREWREKKRKNWSEQQTQNCTLSRSKAFALTYQCISQRWSMWFVDNLSKIIFSEDNLLYEKIYQMLIHFYIDRVQNMQSLVLSRQVRFAVISTKQSPCRVDICQCRYCQWQCDFFLVVVYFFFPENNNFFCAQSSVQIWSVIFLTSIISVPIGVRSISNQTEQFWSSRGCIKILIIVRSGQGLVREVYL